MQDGRLRRAAKAVALFGFRVNLGTWRAWRRLRGDRPWLLGGSCNPCAPCCEAPAIGAGRPGGEAPQGPAPGRVILL